MADLKGKVLTVLGPISPEDLGVVLPHEHLLLDFSKALTAMPPDYPTLDPTTSNDLKNLPIVMENLGAIRQYPYSNVDNIVVTSQDELIQELKLYKQSGGGTLCDLTVTGIRTRPEVLPQISLASGVHIIHGSGFYVNAFIPDNVKNMKIDEIADVIVKEIHEGFPGTNVKCGVIGEIGCSWPLTESEKKALQGAAIAQTRTGAPLIIHPGRNDAAPFEIVDVLKEAGADISRTVMSHVDRTILDKDKLLKFAATGCGIEYDLFGIECSHYQFETSIDMPSDAQRIQMVKCLIDNGYKDKVFLSHDIHTKHRMVKYGGHGYSHLLVNIIPKMLDRGIPQDAIDQMMKINPKKWLTFV